MTLAVAEALTPNKPTMQQAHADVSSCVSVNPCLKQTCLDTTYNVLTHYIMYSSTAGARWVHGD